MRLAPALTLVAALNVVGCASPDEVSGPRPGGTHATDVRTEPELMRAVPDAVAAGGETGAVFSSGSTRDPGFALERATDDGWAWWFATLDVPRRQSRRARSPRLAAASWIETDALFPTQRGTYPSIRNVQRRFRGVVRALGLPTGTSPHTRAIPGRRCC
jgi:hypothetical protein